MAYDEIRRIICKSYVVDDVIDDCKYLGSSTESSEKDIATRKAQAWRALNEMNKIWSSTMSADLKRRFFTATVESILLYGCETWTVTKAQEKSLDGTYTRMLRKVLNIHWSSRTTNKELYRDMPAVSDKIASRRLQLAGHCQRHPELCANKVLLWEPTHGQKGRGRPRSTFLDVLKRDTGVASTDELAELMSNRTVWRSHVVSRLRAQQ